MDKKREKENMTKEVEDYQDKEKDSPEDNIKSIKNSSKNSIDDTITERMMNSSGNNEKNKSYILNNIFDLQTLLTQRQDRLWSVLHERYKYNTSIKRGQEFLLNHVDSKTSLIVMYVDLVGSTKMSMDLPVEKMAKIIKAYSHELSSVVESYDGFVLKYVGDAVIAFFPAGFNKYLACDKSFRCAKSMIDVIENVINPIFKKDDYPKLEVKIGIDEGENAVIQYGFDKSAPIDLIGYPMNVTAKITSLTKPNKISVGNNLYKLLHPSIQTKFHMISLKETDWKYIDHKDNSIYKVYTTQT
ncbi:MAG TPA: adenylate/guanylate cyclase domain-containing protein [Verrucomicrobiae bacterium]|nr:adenylate/guanylate cyclase domain-containing protein [Verrucomicrobiae bacterium]